METIEKEECSGFLHKLKSARRFGGSWVRRYFVLKYTADVNTGFLTLTYFRSKNSKKVKGKIKLIPGQFQVQGISPKQFNITLSGICDSDARQNLMLRATSAHEASPWVTALQKVAHSTLTACANKKVDRCSDRPARVDATASTVVQEVVSQTETAKDRSHANSESPRANDFTRITKIDSYSASEDLPQNSPTKELKNDENIESELQSMFDSSTSTPVTAIASIPTLPSKNQPSMTPVKETHSESHKTVPSEPSTLHSPDIDFSDTAMVESRQMSMEKTRVLTPVTNRAPQNSPGKDILLSPEKSYLKQRRLRMEQREAKYAVWRSQLAKAAILTPTQSHSTGAADGSPSPNTAAHKRMAARTRARAKRRELQRRQAKENDPLSVSEK